MSGTVDRDLADVRFRDARSAAGRVERIVIHRMGSLGDTVVALPCFHKLAEAFPDAERYVLTNIPVSSKAAALELILGQSGLIHGVIDYPFKLRSVRQMRVFARRLRALQADDAYLSHATRGKVSLIYRDLPVFPPMRFFADHRRAGDEGRA